MNEPHLQVYQRSLSPLQCFSKTIYCVVVRLICSLYEYTLVDTTILSQIKLLLKALRCVHAGRQATKI